jgi:enoyl-[acyl-carrier protein] reductase I
MAGGNFQTNDWALILGGSSGIGLACAKELADHGMSLCVAHRDLRGAMARIEPDFEKIRATAPRFCAVNGNALEAAGRQRVLSVLREEMGGQGRIKLLLHSIAQGNLKPLLAARREGPEPELEPEDLAATIEAMGTSLFTWVRDLHRENLFAPQASVLSFTSEGSSRSWPGYAAVSAAKAALESVSRSIAVEFGRQGIRCNVIQSGICDTPALRHIPGSERMKEFALSRHPLGRLTTPEDIAGFVYLMCQPEAAWVNGAVLCVDGGESISG